MESVYRSVAGIDVHKKMLAVVIRRQRANKPNTRSGSSARPAQRSSIWRPGCGPKAVSEVVMESTAQYWRPVWYGLEAHFQLHLTHPLKTRAPRGRKSDFRDAQRLADRWSAGDLEESFIPGSEQRAWRWLTRTRVQLKKKMGVIHSHVEGTAGTRRDQTVGGGERFVRGEWLGHAGTHRPGSDRCGGAGQGSARSVAQEGRGVEGSFGGAVGAGLPTVAEAAHGSSAAVAAAGGRTQPGSSRSHEGTRRRRCIG